MTKNARPMSQSRANRRRAFLLALLRILAGSPAVAVAGTTPFDLGPTSMAPAARQLAYTSPSSPPQSEAGEGGASSDKAQAEWWSVHGQSTFVTQYHPRFTSPFRGQNSLDPGNRGNETFDATLF